MQAIQRKNLLDRLKQKTFDLVVIGGGATGAGLALEASSRGLSVALVEKNDFASGTSSRSTKLLHGGVRYLELAVKQRDKGQIDLVREALHERALLLKLAPHLTRTISIFTPIYQWFKVPYYRLGLKAYDWLAGSTNLAKSRWINKEDALKRFKILKPEKFKGGILYYDGQFDDARMDVSIVLTAIDHQASAINYVAVTGLVKEAEKIRGVSVIDRLSNETFEVRASVVVNAAGPFVDTIRKMDNPDIDPLVTVSSGIHLVLDQPLTPEDSGLLTPRTDDGRVLFLLPWLGHTLVGTTDHPDQLTENPKPEKTDIDYLLNHINRHFAVHLTDQNIVASWSGLRPLVSNPKNLSKTSNLSRDHFIEISKSGLVTVTGGKWTTYRSMAIDTLEQIATHFGLKPTPSISETIFIRGGKGFSADLLVERLKNEFGFEEDIIKHLVRAYGTFAVDVANLTKEVGTQRLHARHPMLEAEVIYAIRHEMACHVSDVLLRRTRLGFLDQNAVKECLNRVIERMAITFGWDQERQEAERAQVFKEL